ncbi:MAG: gamma-glutamyl-gamma-aminobutyrate hydrolase family protein [Acidimicrobiia bacterium]|nr:gamma-glutamyl-gamma-aminobutyrate hydrolase family protein [Acidimicrobiia bacterium]
MLDPSDPTGHPGREGAPRRDRPAGTRPLIAVVGRRLPAGRVQGWNEPVIGVLAPYLDALRRAGAWSAVLDPTDAAAPGGVLSRFDGLVLTGGDDLDPSLYGQDAHEATYGTDPAVDRYERDLTLAALDSSTPTLAICRGIQVLNVALGGTLDQHIVGPDGDTIHGVPGTSSRPALHTVDVTPRSLLAEAMGTTAAECSSHHHQALGELAPGLEVTARAADGIVEGVELPGTWLLAVQWHPEETAVADPAQQGLFDALVARASGAGAPRAG